MVGLYCSLQPHCVLRYGSRYGSSILECLGLTLKHPGSSLLKTRGSGSASRAGSFHSLSGSTLLCVALSVGPDLGYSYRFHSYSSESGAVARDKGWILPAPRPAQTHTLSSLPLPSLFCVLKQLLSDGAHLSFSLCRSQPTLTIISLPGCHKCPCKPFCQELIVSCWHDIQFFCH